MENILSSSVIAATLITVFLPIGLLWVFQPVFAHNTYSKEERTSENFECERSLSSIVDISLVVPAYNEHGRLPKMLDSAIEFLNAWSSKRELKFEIVIVDDGSKDSTCSMVQSYMQSSNFIRLVKLGKNRGKGGAVKQGVKESRGRYILMVDADGATEIEDLEKLYDSILKTETKDSALGGTVGVAVGSRAHMEKDSVASRAFYRTVLMHGFHILVMLLCTRKIRDTQCGFKLFTKQAANILFSNLHLERWAFDIEIIFLAELLQIPMVEVAVHWQEVDGSKLIQSKMDVVTTSLQMARDMLCVRLCYLLGIWRYRLKLQE